RAEGDRRRGHPGHEDREAHAMSGNVVIGVRARIAALTAAEEAKLFARGRAADADVARSVSETIADVRARGDAALRDAASRYDRVTIQEIAVPRAAWAAAADRLDPAVRTALHR